MSRVDVAALVRDAPTRRLSEPPTPSYPTPPACQQHVNSCRAKRIRRRGTSPRSGEGRTPNQRAMARPRAMQRFGKLSWARPAAPFPSWDRITPVVNIMTTGRDRISTRRLRRRIEKRSQRKTRSYRGAAREGAPTLDTYLFIINRHGLAAGLSRGRRGMGSARVRDASTTFRVSATPLRGACLSAGPHPRRPLKARSTLDNGPRSVGGDRIPPLRLRRRGRIRSHLDGLTRQGTGLSQVPRVCIAR